MYLGYLLNKVKVNIIVLVNISLFCVCRTLSLYIDLHLAKQVTPNHMGQEETTLSQTEHGVCQLYVSRKLSGFRYIPGMCFGMKHAAKRKNHMTGMGTLSKYVCLYR